MLQYLTRPLDLAIDPLKTWEVWRSGDALSTSQENAVSLLVTVFSLYFWPVGLLAILDWFILLSIFCHFTFGLGALISAVFALAHSSDCQVLHNTPPRDAAIFVDASRQGSSSRRLLGEASAKASCILNYLFSCNVLCWKPAKCPTYYYL